MVDFYNAYNDTVATKDSIWAPVYGQGWSMSANTLFSVFAFFIGEDVKVVERNTEQTWLYN